MIFEDPLAGMQGSLLLLSRWGFALGFISTAFWPPLSTRKMEHQSVLNSVHQCIRMMYLIQTKTHPGDT